MNIYFEKIEKKKKKKQFDGTIVPVALGVVLFGWVVLRSFPEVF
jgi:hypothetical protein